MNRNSLIMASVGGAAALAVAGAALGVGATDDRAVRTTLAAAVAPAATGSPTSAPTSGAPSTGAPTPSGAVAPAGGAVDERRAGEIALARAGGGQIVEVEAEEEDGRQVWSVEVVNGQTEHEVDVDRNDGTVVKAEQEPVDNDDDKDDDDKDDDDKDDDDKDDDDKDDDGDGDDD